MYIEKKLSLLTASLDSMSSTCYYCTCPLGVILSCVLITTPGWVDRSQPVHGGPESKTPQSSEQLKSNNAPIYYE